MRGTQFRVRHFVGAACFSCTSILAALSLMSLPVGAQTAPATTTQSCPVLSIGNPNPGDTITEGGYVISGEAFDPAAQSGAGISRVDLFLGERDQGGLFLGSAVPGTAAGQDARAWSLEVTVPSNLNHGVDFAAYAQSSVSGAETAVTFPVFVGTQPRTVGLVTPTPVPDLTPVVTNNCPGGTPAASAPAPAAAATPGASAPAASAPVVTTSTSCPTLSLGNPNPGDNLIAGGLVISGSASEPGANSGSGVERVDLFLGARDQGGTFLGSAVPGASGTNPNAWSVEVQVPNLGRGVNFAAYAIGDNGQEQCISFPVFVGTPPILSSGAPTPTPVPQTQLISSTCK
jgi:hypothetical protein